MVFKEGWSLLITASLTWKKGRFRITVLPLYYCVLEYHTLNLQGFSSIVLSFIDFQGTEKRRSTLKDFQEWCLVLTDLHSLKKGVQHLRTFKYCAQF